MRQKEDATMNRQCPICGNELDDAAAACAKCGYRMLGSTQSFKPVQLDGIEEDGRRQPALHRFDLRVVRGPQTGIDIDLKQGSLSVGRDPQCDIFLNDMTVSRSHATIEVGADQCVIRDRNSFNGVWVNNRMVEACALQPGDVIQIGAFCLIYRERI